MSIIHYYGIDSCCSFLVDIIYKSLKQSTHIWPWPSPLEIELHIEMCLLNNSMCQY